MTTLTQRKIIKIDEEKCNGCGICVDSCHEGAIALVDGKARLVSDSYCDGLGDCLAPCPTGAISLEVRPAEAYDEVAVEKRKAAASATPKAGGHSGGCPGQMAKTLVQPKPETTPDPLPCGCPGHHARSLKPGHGPKQGKGDCHGKGHGHGACAGHDEEAKQVTPQSQLMNWPVQLALVPPAAPYLKGADILLAADCAPAASPDFHTRFLENKPLIIACPKLDDGAKQVEKLALIFATARPASVTVLRMQVPCCARLVGLAKDAAAKAGVPVRIRSAVLALEGNVLEEEN